MQLTFSVCLSHVLLVYEGSTSQSCPRNHATPIPVSPRLCVDGCVHMLRSVLLQPVPGPVLNLNAHGLNVQMAHCNLLRSLDATLPSRAAWGHRFQLSPPPPVPPSLLLVIEIWPLSVPLFLLYLSDLNTVE